MGGDIMKFWQTQIILKLFVINTTMPLFGVVMIKDIFGQVIKIIMVPLMLNHIGLVYLLMASKMILAFYLIKQIH